MAPKYVLCFFWLSVLMLGVWSTELWTMCRMALGFKWCIYFIPLPQYLICNGNSSTPFKFFAHAAHNFNLALWLVFGLLFHSASPPYQWLRHRCYGLDLYGFICLSLEWLHYLWLIRSASRLEYYMWWHLTWEKNKQEIAFILFFSCPGLLLRAGELQDIESEASCCTGTGCY